MTKEISECIPSALDGELKAWDKKTIMSQWEDVAQYFAGFISSDNLSSTLIAWKLRLLNGESTLFVMEQSGYVIGAVLVSIGFRPGDGVLFVESFALDVSRLNERTRQHVMEVLTDYAYVNGCKAIIGLSENEKFCEMLKPFGFIIDSLFSVRKEL